jgi:hypothetical protein
MQERCVLQPEPTGYISKDWFQESQHVRRDTLCSLPAFQVYLVAYSQINCMNVLYSTVGRYLLYYRIM